MGSELARRAGGNMSLSSILASGRAGREIAKIDAGIEIALAWEDGRATVLRARVGNAHGIGEYAAMRLTAFNLLVSQVAHERPQLEMELRQMQSVLAAGTAQALYDYLNQ